MCIKRATNYGITVDSYNKSNHVLITWTYWISICRGLIQAKKEYFHWAGIYISTVMWMYSHVNIGVRYQSEQLSKYPEKTLRSSYEPVTKVCSIIESCCLLLLFNYSFCYMICSSCVNFSPYSKYELQPLYTRGNLNCSGQSKVSLQRCC